MRLDLAVHLPTWMVDLNNHQRAVQLAQSCDRLKGLEPLTIEGCVNGDNRITCDGDLVVLEDDVARDDGSDRPLTPLTCTPAAWLGREPLALRDLLGPKWKDALPWRL